MLFAKDTIVTACHACIQAIDGERAELRQAFIDKHREKRDAAFIASHRMHWLLRRLFGVPDTLPVLTDDEIIERHAPADPVWDLRYGKQREAALRLGLIVGNSHDNHVELTMDDLVCIYGYLPSNILPKKAPPNAQAQTTTEPSGESPPADAP